MGALIEINTDGLAKLGETISNALGLSAFGRKKMADAEAYATIKQVETETTAELLRLKGQDEIADYILARESRKMNNVKSVVEKSTSQFAEGEKVSDEAVDKDWSNRFFSIVEDVSDESLHDIWARILAGEVKQPGSFSLRTLDLLRNITKEEAELFIKASAFYVANNFICTEEPFLSLHETLLLGEAGLINSEGLTKPWDVKPNDKLEILIDKKTLFILYNDRNSAVHCNVSVKKLSKAGTQIMSLLEKSDRSGFYNNLAQIIKSKGISRVTKHEIIDCENDCTYLINGEEI